MVLKRVVGVSGSGYSRVSGNSNGRVGVRGGGLRKW